VHAVLHEVARAAFDVLEIPVWGREEHAADRVAGYMMFQFGEKVAYRTLVGTAWFLVQSGVAGTRLPTGEFSYVLIDCPPSLNLLTVNAMAASDAILVPLQCEFFALEGLSQLLQTVEQVRSTLNPNLSIHGIVLTMFDSRNNLSNQVVADVRQFMGAKVYNTMIPRNVRISEAPSYGKPVLVYDLKCVGSEAYLKLATEVIQRERELRTH